MPATLRMFCTQLLAGVLLLAATACTTKTAMQSPPALTLTIIPTSYANRFSPEPTISFGEPNHFHVLLTNTSSTPVNIFEEWNSWGYYGLSFEITYSDGRKDHPMKKVRGWQHNYPSTITIAPHGFCMFEVDFGTEWDDSIRAGHKAKDGIKCRMRAIYTIEPTDKSLRNMVIGPTPVWSGTVSSEESAYTVWP